MNYQGHGRGRRSHWSSVTSSTWAASRHWLATVMLLIVSTAGSSVLADGFPFPGFGKKKSRSGSSKSRIRKHVGDEPAGSSWKFPTVSLPTFRLPTWNLKSGGSKTSARAAGHARSSSPSVWERLQGGTRAMWDKATGVLPSWSSNDSARPTRSRRATSKRSSGSKSSSWLRWPWSKESSSAPKGPARTTNDFLALPRVGERSRPR